MRIRCERCKGILAAVVDETGAFYVVEYSSLSREEKVRYIQNKNVKKTKKHRQHKCK